jgi:hypothetical protein
MTTTNDGHHYNYSHDNEKNRNIRAWMRLIEKDRNYARILFGLPLQQPIKKGIREARDNWEAKQAGRRTERHRLRSQAQADTAPDQPLP